MDQPHAMAELGILSNPSRTTDSASPIPIQARSLRAAELTLKRGDDWFQIVTAYSDLGELAGGGSSVSIGGSGGSSGRTSVGVGVGIALQLGGGSSSVEHVMEIVTASGAKPDNPDAYDASDVLANLGGA
ncbi:MAG: hypothetical protein HRT80_00495 [Henriciella sp.]|nr:hypothetical protein [Henriciella sp.]